MYCSYNFNRFSILSYIKLLNYTSNVKGIHRKGNIYEDIYIYMYILENEQMLYLLIEYNSYVIPKRNSNMPNRK